MTHGDGGKGDARRPCTGYEEGYDRIFGKKSQPEQQDNPPAEPAEINKENT